MAAAVYAALDLRTVFVERVSVEGIEKRDVGYVSFYDVSVHSFVLGSFTTYLQGHPHNDSKTLRFRFICKL